MKITYTPILGFPTDVENMGGGGGALQNFKPTNLLKMNFFTHIFQGF